MAGVDILATAFNGANAAFIADLYAKWSAEPGSVDPSFSELFEALNDEARAILGDATGASWAPRAWSGDSPDHAAPAAPATGKLTAAVQQRRASDLDVRAATKDSLRALMMIRTYRVRGHLEAQLDPLGLQVPKPHPELDPATYGFGEADMDRPIFIDHVLGLETATSRQILQVLRQTYCGPIGVEFMHIQDPDQKAWIQRRVEGAPWATAFDAETRKTILRQLTEARVQEDYLVGVVHALDQQGGDNTPTAEALLASVDLAALLSGEHRPLSAAARADLLRHRFSYYEDDLVVLTWDRAFVYEPRGDADVTDVIEVANAQLLEMRYYDELLDAELPRMNAHVAAARSGLNPLAARRYAGLARRLYSLVADVTELTERVDNALQVTEDVYLARVYAAALDQFRVAAVTAAVNRKLAIMRETYTALYDEAAGARAEVLEIAIVVLIMFEIVMAFVRG